MNLKQTFDKCISKKIFTKTGMRSGYYTVFRKK